MQEIDLYIACSDGGYKPSRMRTIEMYWKVKSGCMEERRSSRGVLTRNRADLNAIALFTNQVTEPCDLTIHCDSSYIYVVFEHMNRWEEVNYKTPKGKDIEHADVVRAIRKGLKGCTVKVFYEKNEVVEKLRELADTHEKQAAERDRYREILNSLCSEGDIDNDYQKHQ